MIYRSRTGDYDLPAIITATRESLYQPNVEAGHIPGLSSSRHVHLTVFSPGPALGGSYTEWDIPEAGALEVTPAPGTWRWPVRV